VATKQNIEPVLEIPVGIGGRGVTKEEVHA